jgi:hypothetical protein
MGPDGEVEETIACVAAEPTTVTMEWRVLRKDGARTVTAARFRRDGTLLAVWRGPPGGVGRTLRAVGGGEDLEALEARANRMGQTVGVSTSDARRDEEWEIEEVDTPAGRIRCRRHRLKVSLLFASSTCTTWHSIAPLPLTSLVKCEMRGPGRFVRTQVLSVSGKTGATSTLRAPPPQPAS